MTRWSIRARLACWFAVVLGLVLVLMAATTWWALRASFAATVDEGLAGRVASIARFLGGAAEPASSGELHEDLREYAALDPGWDLIRIYDASGTQVFQAGAFERGGLPPAPVPGLPDGPRYEDLVLGGRPLRMLSSRAMVGAQAFTVQVAVPMGDLQHTVDRLRKALLLLIPIGILLAAGGGYWISGRALAPVDRITATARGITARELGSRLEVPPTGDELQRLSETLNDMLARLEAAFLEARRFTADASHELRTPISVIRTSAEIALRRDRPAVEYRQALSDIQREAERTSTLVQDLLTLARADAGVDGLQRTDVDLVSLANGVRQRFAASCEGAGLSLEADTPATPVLLNGDLAAISRLAVILVDNAVKYTPAPGRVTVRIRPEKRTAVLEVEDTGPGIAAEDLPRVFDRFYRADKARSRDSGGAGLGLSIARWIAERHGGSIAIDSQPGCGCRVTVRLPR